MSERRGRAGLDPQVAALLAASDGAPETTRDPRLMRAEYERVGAELGGAPEPVAEVRELDGPPPMRVYVPEAAHGTVLYLHGGGWVLGSPDSHDRLARILANAAGAAVAVADYRLAPEHRHPAAVEDAEAALELVAAGRPGPLAVAGDSAGGGLAAVLARRHPGLRLQALAYPVLDAGMDTGSYRRHAEGFGLTAEEMAWFFARYGGDPADPDVSPLRARDLSGAPAAFIVLAGHDVLRDEGEAYASRLRAAGVPATVRVHEGMVHGFLRWPARVDAAREAIGELGAALRAALRS